MMIQIETDEGILLSYEDSKSFIENKLQTEFEDFSDFIKCESMKFPYYWGDVLLMGTEKEYYIWIVHIAERIFEN